MAETKNKDTENIKKESQSEEVAKIDVLDNNQKADSVEGDYNAPEVKDPAVFVELEYKSNNSITDDIKNSYLEFKKATKLPKIIDLVTMILTFAVIITSLVILFTVGANNRVLSIVFLVVTGVVLLASFVVSRIFSKKKTRHTTQYLKEYETILNGSTAKILKISNPKLSVAGKIDDQDVIRTHYFATINSIQSRGIVEGNRNNKNIRLGEVAVIVPPTTFADANQMPSKYIDINGKEVEVTNKVEEIVKEEPPVQTPSLFGNRRKAEPTETYMGLFGKLFSYDLLVDSSESIIIAFKGEYKTTYMPNYLTGFEAIKLDNLNDDIIVYAVDINKSKKFFDKKGIELLNKIAVDGDFTSGFITANSYGIRVGLNLSDRVMQLPLDEKVATSNAFDNYLNATKDMFAFVDYMESKLK